MKQFRVIIEIDAEDVGLELEKGDGATINFGVGGDTTPEYIVSKMVKMLKNNLEMYRAKVQSAELIIDLDDDNTVVDNLLTSVRKRYNWKDEAGVISAFVNEPVIAVGVAETQSAETVDSAQQETINETGIETSSGVQNDAADNQPQDNQ